MPANPHTDSARDAARVTLATLTTIGLGGPAPARYRATSAAQVADLLGGAHGSSGLDDSGGALVVGGGSNLVIADDGIDVPVLQIAIGGIEIAPDGADPAGEAVVTIGAGENWDTVVSRVVEAGWCGIECLSGIPGSAGATPIQNVGAYGVEIADVLIDVDLYDRRSRTMRTVSASDLRLGYRSSVLRGTDTAVVTALRLRVARTPHPVRYAELARRVGVEVGQAAPAPAVRSAVLDLRHGKGMVIDPADPDTRSVGSFFTNPILTATQWAQVRPAIEARVGTDVRIPTYPTTAAGQIKLSAAWLIERAGFTKGYPLPARPGAGAALSTKHTLALTNRGGTTAELIDLAREIRDGVRGAFGVTLRPEPILVGVRL